MFSPGHIRRGSLAALMFLLFVTRIAAAAAPGLPVERIRVDVATDTPLPEVLKTRVEASVERVAERIILGQPIDTVQRMQGEYIAKISEVFKQVLTGYRIEQLTMQVGVETKISMKLISEGDQVAQVSIRLDAPGLSTACLAYLQEELTNRREMLTHLLLGLPVDAFSWMGMVLIPPLEEVLYGEFPGFRHDIQIVPGTALELNLTMTAIKPVVQSVTADIASSTLPRLVVEANRKGAAAYLDVLQGAPVAFIRRYQVKLENLIGSWLNNDHKLTRLGLEWRVKLYPGTITRVKMLMDADAYSLTGYGYLEIAEECLLGVAVQAGVRLLGNWELSGGLRLDTGGQGPDWRGTLNHSLPGDMTIGYTYGSRANENLIWLRYASGRGDFFVLDQELETGTVSATIGVTTDNQFNLSLTVDTTRKYKLLVQLGL